MKISAGMVHCCQTGRHKRDAFYAITDNQGNSLYPESLWQGCHTGKGYTGNDSMGPGVTAFILGVA